MKPETVPLAAEVEIEQHTAGSFHVKPNDVPRIAQRAEAQLVHEYRDHMDTQGFQVSRMKYESAGEASMYSDAWVSAKNLLIEAKSAQGRDALRQAIGQLYDYRRFHTPVRPVLAVLLSMIMPITGQTGVRPPRRPVLQRRQGTAGNTVINGVPAIQEVSGIASRHDRSLTISWIAVRPCRPLPAAPAMAGLPAQVHTA